MDIEYLKKAESDLSDLLAQTLKTYSDLESKAKYVATGFVAFVSGLFGYSLSSFTALKEWQQFTLLGAGVPLAYCFYQVVQGLKVREYKDGIYFESAEKDKNIESYLSLMIEELPSRIETNKTQNNEKGSAVNRAFMSLVLFGPLAILSGAITTSLSVYFDNFGFLRLSAISVVISAIATVISAKHLIPLINKPPKIDSESE